MPRAGRTVGGRPALGRLTRRPQFLAVAGARRKVVCPGLILQVRAHDERQRPQEDEPAVRVGFTASRKVGNAVTRNRARRRLRAAAAEVMAPHAAAGNDYVLIARGETPTRPYAELKGDLERALRRLKAWRDGDIREDRP
ncbi:MAG TPA: ribonuclease P protein component [Alphaproteobacteria bacterium]|nr:ribonuclease P protein component [Alphaproteobacteria bacterium]